MLSCTCEVCGLKWGKLIRIISVSRKCISYTCQNYAWYWSAINDWKPV